MVQLHVFSHVSNDSCKSAVQGVFKNGKEGTVCAVLADAVMSQAIRGPLVGRTQNFWSAEGAQLSFAAKARDESLLLCLQPSTMH